MFNQVIAYGRLVANPELRQTQNSILCSFTIAIDRPKSKDGNQATDFIKCTCWNKTADMVSKYFSKGKPIMITGRLQNNDYTDKNGIKHYSYVVLVSNVSFSINDNSQNQAVDGSQAYTQGNYTPNYRNGSQAKYNANTPNQHQPPAPVYPSLPSEDIDLSDFEQILSDTDVPF
jgi:single-strand DNA-binding protein